MCQPDVTKRETDTIRNGQNTQTQQYNKPQPNEDKQKYLNRKKDNVKDQKVLHESWEWYDSCNRRDRNKGKLG